MAQPLPSSSSLLASKHGFGTHRPLQVLLILSMRLIQRLHSNPNIKDDLDTEPG